MTKPRRLRKKILKYKSVIAKAVALSLSGKYSYGEVINHYKALLTSAESELERIERSRRAKNPRVSEQTLRHND